MKKSTLLGPLAAVVLLVGLFEDNIGTAESDSTIRQWLAGAGNGSWLAHTAAEAVSGVLLVVFAQVLVGRLTRGSHVDATPASATLARCVSALGTTVGTTVVIGAGLFGAVPIGRLFEHAPDPDPSVYRYLMAASASVFVIFLSAPAAALAASASLLGMRLGTMPRWLGIAGLVLAALILVSAFVAPLMVFGLWLFVTGVGLAFDRAPVGDRPQPALA